MKSTASWGCLLCPEVEDKGQKYIGFEVSTAKEIVDHMLEKHGYTDRKEFTLHMVMHINMGRVHRHVKEGRDKTGKPVIAMHADVTMYDGPNPDDDYEPKPKRSRKKAVSR